MHRTAWRAMLPAKPLVPEFREPVVSLWLGPDAHLVLWWVGAGALPTISDAKDRLQRLRRHGPSREAFTFRSLFPAPDATEESPPIADEWFCPT